MKLYICALFIITAFFKSSLGQITLINTYDAASGDLCGVGYDPGAQHIYVYPCFGSEIKKYSTAGIYISAITSPGETANDVDIEIAPENLTLDASSIASGTILFINGESDSAEVYAIDAGTGNIIDTLLPSFGISHVVGGGYHTLRNTLFMVQDNVPSGEFENLVAEIDPVNGDTLNTFQVIENFNVSYGDLDIEPYGDLFIVSSAEDSVAVFSPDGVFIGKHALPIGVTSISGLALDCDKSEAWMVSNNGQIYHLGNMPCETYVGINNAFNSGLKMHIAPNPFNDQTNIQVIIPTPGQLEINLLNMYGSVVEEINNNNSGIGTFNFNLINRSLTPGIYFLKTELNELTIIEKILVF